MGRFKTLWTEAQELLGDLLDDMQDGDEPGPKELIAAEKRCPDVKFVKSCREFFNKRGFLSEKQRNALTYAGTPNRKRRYFCGDDPQY